MPQLTFPYFASFAITLHIPVLCYDDGIQIW